MLQIPSIAGFHCMKLNCLVRTFSPHVRFPIFSQVRNLRYFLPIYLFSARKELQDVRRQAIKFGIYLKIYLKNQSRYWAHKTLKTMVLRKGWKDVPVKHFLCPTRQLTLSTFLSNRLASCCSSDIADIPESEWERIGDGDGDLREFMSGCLDPDVWHGYILGKLNWSNAFRICVDDRGVRDRHIACTARTLARNTLATIFTLTHWRALVSGTLLARKSSKKQKVNRKVN